MKDFFKEIDKDNNVFYHGYEENNKWNLIKLNCSGTTGAKFKDDNGIEHYLADITEIGFLENEIVPLYVFDRNAGIDEFGYSSKVNVVVTNGDEKNKIKKYVDSKK